MRVKWEVLVKRLEQRQDHHVCVQAQSLQLCPTLCDAMDHSLPGSSVHGTFQARILKWVAMRSSRGSSPSREQTCISSTSCIAGEFFTAEPRGKPQDYHEHHVSACYNHYFRNEKLPFWDMEPHRKDMQHLLFPVAWPCIPVFSPPGEPGLRSFQTRESKPTLSIYR